jgi:hypothetical protein
MLLRSPFEWTMRLQNEILFRWKFSRSQQEAENIFLEARRRRHSAIKMMIFIHTFLFLLVRINLLCCEPWGASNCQCDCSAMKITSRLSALLHFTVKRNRIELDLNLIGHIWLFAFSIGWLNLTLRWIWGWWNGIFCMISQEGE